MEKRHSSKLIASALDSFELLEKSISFLIDCLLHHGYKIYFHKSKLTELSYPFEPSSDFERLSMAISDLYYRSNEKGVETRKYHAVVICSKESIEAVKSVNLMKKNFSISIREIQNESIHSLNEFKECFSQFVNTRTELRMMGMARVNLNHCYRKIHLFESMPHKIHYSTSRHEKSIVKVSIKEAEKMLLKLKNGYNKTHIEIQVKKLSELHSETNLAIVRDKATHSKVNLFYNTGNSSHLITRKPGIPIFILEDGTLPDVRFTLKNSRKDIIKPRSDIKIESEVFLPSISAYKYLSQ